MVVREKFCEDWIRMKLGGDHLQRRALQLAFLHLRVPLPESDLVTCSLVGYLNVVAVTQWRLSTYGYMEFGLFILG
jgi:hypothetical protein